MNSSGSEGESIWFFFGGDTRSATGITQAVCTTLRFFTLVPFIGVRFNFLLDISLFANEKKKVVGITTILLQPSGSFFKNKNETVQLSWDVVGPKKNYALDHIFPLVCIWHTQANAY